MTGGRTVINRNMPEDTVSAIFNESQSYYLLAVEAGIGRSKDERRTIEVKVRGKDLRVSTQRAYLPRSVQPAVGSSPALASPLSDSLGGLLPDGTLPLKMTVAAFAGPDDRKALIAVNVDAQAFAQSAPSTLPLRLSVKAVDQTGRSVASTEQTSTVVRSRPASNGASPINIRTHFDLSPGDYEVRAALTDPATTLSASVFSHILVPSFSSDRLSLSDVVIEPGGTSLVAASPLPPTASTTARVFQRADPVQVFVQVYQGTARSTPLLPVDVTTQIIDTQGRVVANKSEPLPEGRFHDRRADYRITIPTPSLSPGEYLLAIRANAGNETMTRFVRFRMQ